MAKKKILNAVLILIMLSGLGGTGYLLYVKTTLDAEIISLNNEIDRGNSLLRAAKKKYTQEKAKLGTCMRAKMAEEIKNAKMKKDIADLEVQKAEVQNQLEGLVKKHEKKIASLDQTIEKLKSIRERIEKSRAEIIEKYKASVRSEREKTAAIKTLEAEKKEMAYEISHLEKELDRNFKHNRRLSEIAEDLTNKYREKSGGSEPFTKLGMIEMEHLVQNYIKQIDKERIIEQ